MISSSKYYMKIIILFQYW